MSSILGQGIKISHATWHGQKKQNLKKIFLILKNTRHPRVRQTLTTLIPHCQEDLVSSLSFEKQNEHKGWMF